MARASTEFDDWIKGWSTPAESTYQKSDGLAFQRWFKFKEAFSPLLVKNVIDELDQVPNTILDCFGGSGTTAIVAQMLGISSTLIEVNPFLADVIESKVTAYGNFDIPSTAKSLLQKSSEIRISKSQLRGLPPTFVEPGKSGRWLFNYSAIVAIEQIRLAILDLTNLDQQRFFKVALGSILVEASNVRIDGKARRYRREWEQRNIDASAVRSLFVIAVAAMAEDIARFPNSSKSTAHKVIRGDSRKALEQIPESSIDLAIFSPPYPNTFDYTDIYNIELWILRYFNSAIDNRNLRLETMRSHVQVAWEKPLNIISSVTLTKTILDLRNKSSELWNKNIPDMVLAYFVDLNKIIECTKRALKPNGSMAIIVGNSAYAGITIECSSILGEIADNHRLKVKRCDSVRVMRTSSQQTNETQSLNEWLLVLSKS